MSGCGRKRRDGHARQIEHRKAPDPWRQSRKQITQMISIRSYRLLGIPNFVCAPRRSATQWCLRLSLSVSLPFPPWCCLFLVHARVEQDKYGKHDPWFEPQRSPIPRVVNASRMTGVLGRRVVRTAIFICPGVVSTGARTRLGVHRAGPGSPPSPGRLPPVEATHR